MDSNAKLLLEKYKAGTCTAEEIALLESWYLKEASVRNIIAGEINFDKIAGLKLTESEPDIAVVRAMPQVRHIKVWQVAASIALIAGIGFFADRYRNALKSDHVQPKYVVNQTPKGAIRKIVLSDGSTVWLNAGSVLKYPKTFEGKVRNVELVDGQVFFDIKHMDGHPFVVKASNLNITVLGTSFDVKAYKNEKNHQSKRVDRQGGDQRSGTSKQAGDYVAANPAGCFK